MHLARRLLVALIVALVCGPACAQPLIQIYAIRGLAGVAFSRGMNHLCDEVADIPEVACSVEDWFNESRIRERAEAAQSAGLRLVLVGHSLGAHAALQIGAAMKEPVPLIVSIDPNWFAPPAVPANAGVVLNYYQDFDVFGRATLTPPPDFAGEFRQFRRNEAHVNIDKSPEIHAEILARVRGLVASLTMPPPPMPPATARRPAHLSKRRN